MLLTLLNLYILSIVPILSACGFCWYYFVFDLRLLTHSCVFLWIVDETMLLTISVKWLIWNSAISHAKWIEGKQINDEVNSLSERVEPMFNLHWPSRKHRSVNIGVTVSSTLVRNARLLTVTCICWHTYNYAPKQFLVFIFQFVKNRYKCSKSISTNNSGRVLWFTRKHQFNSNHRSAWSMLKRSPGNSISF